MTTDHRHTTKAPGTSSASAIERVVWLLYALVGATILLSALVLLGNDPQQAVWLLALLAAGIGQGLFLPSTFAWFGGLAAVVLWVIFRQVTGLWVPEELVQSVLEVGGLTLSIVLAVLVRKDWERVQHELVELRILQRVLVAGEAGTGLLPREVAELRVAEEVDRARQFRRPLGLLLVEVERLSHLPMERIDFEDVFQAVVRQLVSVSLVHDIPFRVDANRVGLVMPERDWEDLYRDTELIVAALKRSLFLDSEEHSQSIEQYARLYFGLGTYQGEASGTIELMRAAEDSLDVSRELAAIGESSVTAYAMPAAPIMESTLAAPEGGER